MVLRVLILLWYHIYFTIIIAGGDQWSKVKSILDAKKSHLDYLSTNSHDLDSKKMVIPKSYSLGAESQYNSDFWSLHATHEQRTLYHDLVESSDKYNNTEATYTLAQLHLWGNYDFPHNKSLAFQYLSKFNLMTDFKNSSAVFELGVLYSTGAVGTMPINTAKGLVYFEKAALLGDLRAKQALAYRYFVGLNVPRNCDKALILYREIAEQVRQKFTPEEWNINFPVLESYNIRISDINNGLIGPDLNMITTSLIRTKSQRPDMASLIYTQMNEGEIILRFGSNSLFFGGDDGEVVDELADLYYTSLDLFQGTYNNERDPAAARRILETVFLEHDYSVGKMENLQIYFYGRCLEMLGHIYLVGDGVPAADVATAELYLLRSVAVFNHLQYVVCPAYKDLGLICQYGYNNITKALEYYQQIVLSNTNDGNVNYQLSKIAMVYPKLEVGDPLTHMQQAYSRGHIPSIFEFGRILEDGMNDHFNCDDMAYLFKTFIEENDWISAPQLKDSYVKLLLGDIEPSLWGYILAAEQGFESAQVSAAYILNQRLNLIDSPLETTIERKQLGVSYYSRAFRLHNIDAGVVAGDLYYSMGDYTRAITMYQSASLKHSTQAMWNLGYMYEYGLGVEKDYYMAKRFYDEALEFKPRILIGIKFSLLKLSFKTWLSWLTGESIIDQNNPEYDTIMLPFYKKIVRLFQNVRSTNSESVKTSESSTSYQQHIFENIAEAFGLRIDELINMAIMVALMIFNIWLRAADARQIN